MLKINKKVIVALATTFSLLSAFPTSANTLPREVVKQEEMGQFPNNLVYPWNISKSNGENFRCTGTFIGNNFFLSAGHCITDQKETTQEKNPQKQKLEVTVIQLK